MMTKAEAVVLMSIGTGEKDIRTESSEWQYVALSLQDQGLVCIVINRASLMPIAFVDALSDAYCIAA